MPIRRLAFFLPLRRIANYNLTEREVCFSLLLLLQRLHLFLFIADDCPLRCNERRHG